MLAWGWLKTRQRCADKALVPFKDCGVTHLYASSCARNILPTEGRLYKSLHVRFSNEATGVGLMKSKSRIRILRRKAAESQGWQCYYCHFPMWESDPEVFRVRFALSSRAVWHFRCTAEHLEARYDGGRDIEENIVAACHYCNRNRHRKKRPRDAMSYARFVRSRIEKGQ